MNAFLWVFIAIESFNTIVHIVRIALGFPQLQSSPGQRACDVIFTLAMVGWAVYLLGATR